MVEDNYPPVAKDNNHVAAPRGLRAGADWPTLLAKLFDDFIRIVRGEIRLATASIAPGIDSVLMRILSRLALAVMGLCGVVCLMAAAILLLHKYLEWWAAFGLMGLGLLFLVLVGSLLPRKS
jgi:hypothetical protein